MNKIITIILVFCSLIALSQPSEFIDKAKARQLKKYAISAERVGDYFSAIDYYEHYIIKKPEDFNATYKLAELCLKTRDYEKASRYFHNVYLSPDKSDFPLTLYFYALAIKYQGEYDDAKTSFQKFMKENKKGEERSKYKKLAKKDIAGCDIATRMIDSSLKITIAHLDTSVNKAHIDFSPIIVDEKTLWYSSLKEDTINYYEYKDSLTKPVHKFYEAKLKNGKWETIRELKDFNDPNYNVGNGAFSPDKNRFYFTKCKRDWKNEMICHIWQSEKKDFMWSLPVELNEDINPKQYTATQPTIGKDPRRGGDIVYFVSNRPGGKGGYDIWYSLFDKRKNKFKKSKKLSSKINTIGNEFTPYYDNNTKTLYFSSDFLPGMGGFDVFKNTGEQNTWFETESVGYPINSSTDDIYFTTSKNKRKGFFVSNRIGGVSLKNKTCCDDIYEFNYTEFIDVSFEGHLIANIDNSVFARINKLMGIEATKQKTDSIRIFLRVKSADKKETIELITTYTNLKSDFKFNLEPNKYYELMVDNFGYFNRIISISTQNIKRSTVLRDTITIDPVPTEPIPINIYYPFDQSNLTQKEKNKIDASLFIIMQEISSVKVEISSHTDNKGKDEYNLELSQRRAQSVVDYLIQKGIDKARLVAKGYGETKPIAKNVNPDGSDNEKGRAKNRRTEFKFLGNLNDFND